MKTLNEIGKAILTRFAKSLNAEPVFESNIDSITMYDEYPKGCDIYAWDWKYGLTGTDYSHVVEWCGEINKGINSVAIGDALYLFSSIYDEGDIDTYFSERATNVRFSHLCLHNQDTNQLFIYRVTDGMKKLKTYLDRVGMSKTTS